MTSVRFRVIEPFRSIFYAPNLVAIHGGHFAAEGLEIALTTASHELNAADALRDGRVVLFQARRDVDRCDLGGHVRSVAHRFPAPGLGDVNGWCRGGEAACACLGRL